MKQLLPRVPKYFKTNLHTHSTISDGKLSPQEVKEGYKAKGYQVLSLTDHNVIVDHSDMNDPDFLLLTGMELNYNDASYRSGFDGKTYHFNLIAKRPDNLWSPWYARNNRPQAQAYNKLITFENMDMRHDVDITNAMIAKANEQGFLVMYNHPYWSCHSYTDYAPLKGLWGMELRNTDCRLTDENNTWVLREMLNLGNKVFPLGTDDMHKPEDLGGSWIMLGAEKLEYDAVIAALEKGDFYMSCGPEIYDLTIEENLLKISCSDARLIRVENHGRFARKVEAENGNLVREASFDLEPFFEKADENSYIRLTVTAPDGSYAATRAYYLNELI